MVKINIEDDNKRKIELKNKWVLIKAFSDFDVSNYWMYNNIRINWRKMHMVVAVLQLVLWRKLIWLWTFTTLQHIFLRCVWSNLKKKRTCEIGILHDTLLMLDGGKLRVFKSEVPNFPFSVKFNLKSSFSGLTKLFDILEWNLS